MHNIHGFVNGSRGSCPTLTCVLRGKRPTLDDERAMQIGGKESKGGVEVRRRCARVAVVGIYKLFSDIYIYKNHSITNVSELGFSVRFQN